jgi:hypothetical protein
MRPLKGRVWRGLDVERVVQPRDRIVEAARRGNVRACAADRA